MQNYKYTAINLQKKKFTGVFTAEDERDLATQLARQNLFLISCHPYSGKTPSAFFTLGTGGVSISDLTTFCRQYSIMINAGISILDGLASLKDQAFSAFFKSLLQVIYEDVKSGVALSEAINRHDKVFPEFFRSMIYVGEASGKLEMVFDALADYYEKDSTMRRKVKSALSYPIMLIGMTIAIVILMMTLIIPTFKDTLADLDVTPQGFTKVVYDISDFLTANWLNLLAAIAVIGVGIFLFARTEKGAYFFDKLAFRMPVIGKIQVAMLSSRFARSFGLLLSSGMDMAEALRTAEVIVTNRDAKKRFIAASEDIRHGMPMATAFGNYNLFPQVLLQMIAVGEKTAALDEILGRSCNFFDEQTEETVTSATSKLQPAILLVMGVVIGGLFLAVYSPIISIMTSIG